MSSIMKVHDSTAWSDFQAFLAHSKLDDVRVSSLIRSRVRHIRTAGVGEAMTIAQGVHFRKRGSGSLAMFAAILRASFLVGRLARSAKSEGARGTN